MKPRAVQLARAAVQAVGVGYTYDEMDCQASVSYTHLTLPTIA